MSRHLVLSLLIVSASLSATTIQARSTVPQQEEAEQESAVIPSPNNYEGDIERTNTVSHPQASLPTLESQQAATVGEAIGRDGVPVYVSPFARSLGVHFDRQESSHAPPNYAPRPATLMPAASSAGATDPLKTSASYGHHHHGGHHGYDHSGWLDMGAWTGGKGAFGWYADYPVGGKHHGYGRR